MRKSTSFFLLLFISNLAFAQSEIFSTEAGAIGGYDPVAYFKESKPVPGKKEISFLWKGETWYFASTENRNSFKKDPAKYEPQFGGFCAYGVAEGHKAKIDPQAWTIVDGKLYLNYNQDVRTLWNKDQKKFIDQAQKKWADVKKEKL
jgi:YHS domain-containing protein